MGQLRAVDRLPEVLYNKLIDMINNPALTQAVIVDAINTETGKQVISESSLNRFIKGIKKLTGKERGRGRKTPAADESLARIATALDRIAFSLENQYKKPS
jgi:t-SNARE complex subunit (syntaxin)